jgi:hypothetical protein
MPTRFSGGCACGAIRYECSAEALMAFNCHCRDCQRATGSAFSSGLVVPTAAFIFTKGEPKYYTVKAESGHSKSQGFCSHCGSPLVGKIAEAPETIGIHASSLDDPGVHKPTLDFWTRSAQPWDYLNPALQKFDTEPAQ